jgi:hypothetical protein
LSIFISNKTFTTPSADCSTVILDMPPFFSTHGMMPLPISVESTQPMDHQVREVGSNGKARRLTRMDCCNGNTLSLERHAPFPHSPIHEYDQLRMQLFQLLRSVVPDLHIQRCSRDRIAVPKIRDIGCDSERSDNGRDYEDLLRLTFLQERKEASHH